MDVSSTLTNFSPALGHTYTGPSTSSQKSLESQSLRGSREGTAVPDAISEIKKPTTSSSYNHLDIMTLQESMIASMKFDDEYMDDWPITGEPGNFHKARVEKEKPVLQLPASRGPLSAPSKPSPAAAPPSLKTDIPRKDSKAGKSPKTPGTAGGLPKPKRKKSKVPGAVSPS